MFNKIFSFKGEFNRKEYLIYGILLPIVIFALAAATSSAMHIDQELSATLGLVAILLIVYISFVAVIKRARATATSTWLVVLLWFVLTPVAILYLVFAPSVQDKTQQKGSRLVSLLVIGFVVIVLGVLAAVTIPKLAKSKQETSTQNTALHTTQK